MTAPTAEIDLQSADASSDAIVFLQPAIARIIAGAGFPDERPQQIRRSVAVRRIALGRQILKIAGKSKPPLV